MKKIIALFLTVIMFAFTGIQVCAENNKISVYIDGEKIIFDVEPINKDGRVLVPMRKIFEHLGSDVEWVESNKAIHARCGYMFITMQVDNHKMTVDNDNITLDVTPTIYNERTLVPLRAIAEAFSADVEWVGDENTVKITTKYPKNQYKPTRADFNNKNIRTSYGEREYFDFSIEGNELIITGKIADSSVKQIMILNSDAEHSRKRTPVELNKEFEVSFDLSEIKDTTEIKVFTSNDDSLFKSYLSDILFIEKIGNEYVFSKPLVWENNMTYMSEWVNPVGYIRAEVNDELRNLSNEICKNSNSDYDKVLKIHDWVADNIYYNYDFYYGNSDDISYDELDVYRNKRTVCEGYANLTEALIHAQNIPCRKVHGFALGVGETPHWTAETSQITDSNHAWNQVYLDNRWVNIDTTWDSGNEYLHNEFKYEGVRNHYYFDISDEFFSYNHKYLP